MALVFTLHAPHGTDRLPKPRFSGIDLASGQDRIVRTCTKCWQPFETLFEFNKHVRESHKESGGLMR